MICFLVDAHVSSNEYAGLTKEYVSKETWDLSDLKLKAGWLVTYKVVNNLPVAAFEN